MGIQQGQRILEEASWNVYCGSLLMVKKYAPIIYVIYAIIQYRIASGSQKTCKPIQTRQLRSTAVCRSIVSAVC